MASRAEPLWLLGGLVVFACAARAAASGGAPDAPPPRRTAVAGPLHVHAALGHARLDRADGSVLVDVRLTAAREVASMPIDLALALDVSSAAGERVDLMSQALVAISDLLAPGDRIAVIAFS